MEEAAPSGAQCIGVKKASNAFMLFQADGIARLKAAGLPAGAAGVAAMWKGLSDVERAPYDLMAVESKARYDMQMGYTQ